MNVLFVCLGNICRSPMAAGIMQRIYAEQSLSGVVESAGTADWNVGKSADYRALEVCLEHGIDIRAHRARQVCVEDFGRFDQIFALDRQNEAALRKLAPAKCKHKIELLRPNCEIADPYSKNVDAFRDAFKLIEESCLARVVRG